MHEARFPLAVLLVIGVGCSTPAAPQPEKAEKPADASSSEPAETPTEPPPLSAEDVALIEADPASLSPEQRRKRAHALRRKVMQDPDSPAARTLEDLRRAHEEGLLELPPAEGAGGVVFSTPGSRPAGARGPAGARPDPEADGETRP